MAYIIKSLLPTSSLEFYKNVKDSFPQIALTATNIVLCNTSGSAVTVFLSFFNAALGETFATGAVLYGYSLVANSTLLVNDRIIYLDDTVNAYAGTVDVVSLSMDIINDEGRYITPLP